MVAENEPEAVDPMSLHCWLIEKVPYIHIIWVTLHVSSLISYHLSSAGSPPRVVLVSVSPVISPLSPPPRSASTVLPPCGRRASQETQAPLARPGRRPPPMGAARPRQVQLVPAVPAAGRAAAAPRLLQPGRALPADDGDGHRLGRAPHLPHTDSPSLVPVTVRDVTAD